LVSRAARALPLALLALAAWLAPSGAARGQAVPAISQPVNDTAQLLDPETEAALTDRIVAHRQQTGVQIAVLTVPDTGDLPVEDFAIAVVERWRGGTEGRDDGVLVVLVQRSGRVRIEVGYGLEAELSDAAVRRLLEDTRRRFDAGAYDLGIAELVDGIAARTAERRPGPGDTGEDSSDRGCGLGVPLVLLGGLVLGLLAWLARRSGR
jgi:uncharacterized protein